MRDVSVTLIGAGGIGAITAVVLAKMGVPYLQVFDDDYVDKVNLSTQFHRLADLRSRKVEAVRYMVEEFCDDTCVDICWSRVDADFPPFKLADQIVISAVDSIDARKDIWSVLQNARWSWYLDARMSAEVFQMYCMRNALDIERDWQWYADLLDRQSEDDIADEPCTQKATIYTAAMAAGHIGRAVKGIVMGEEMPKMVTHNIKERSLIVP